MNVERIAHYPQSLKGPLTNILQSAANGQVERFPRGSTLSTTPSIVNLNKTDIPDQEAVWVNAALSPCLFIALVARNNQGEIQEVRAGHFSTNFSTYELDQFLKRDEPNGWTSIWLAGLSQKTNHDSLNKTTESLVERINASGLPISLTWTSGERPEITDSRNQRLVSDLGFGLLSDGENISRHVSFGVTHSSAILISTLFRRSIHQPWSPLRVSLMTVDQGRLEQRYP